jgi:dolichyl-phosphate beta-glucosyltransferase
MTGASVSVSGDPTPVSVVVPAFNEAKSIAGTVQEIFQFFAAKNRDVEVIVSADGDDGTRDVVRRLAKDESRLSVIGTNERRGKGRGIREGVRMARGGVIGFVDADNKTPISEFDRFAGPLADGFDLVIGSRGLRESRVERPQPLYRRVGSKVFAVGMHMLVGLDEIVDTQCGFKFFRGDVARDLFSRQRIDGYMFDVEILYLAKRSGYRVAQVPVRWRDDADSRLQLVRGNLQNAADLLRIRLGPGREPRQLDLVAEAGEKSKNGCTSS